METKARYVLIGMFTLIAITAAFGFVYWLNSSGGLGAKAEYRIRFGSPVSGLQKGSAVLFNGIRVGEVAQLQLSAEDPRQVTATIAVDPGTPVRADTLVGVDVQGLMGAAALALTGGTRTAAIVPSRPGEPPTLVADAAAGLSMTQLAREALRRVDTILADNSGPFHSTMTSLSTFSGALARNSERVDGILAGLERMTAATPSKAAPIVYDLAAPRSFPPLTKGPRGQLVVLEPTALAMFDTQKILVRPNGGEGPGVVDAQWSDSVPKLFQAKIIQSFENANYLRAVGRPMEGLTANFQLMIDIRSFQIVVSPGPIADVEFSAKVLGEGGRIMDARIFHASVPAASLDASTATAALEQAFGKAVTELVVWTSGII